MKKKIVPVLLALACLLSGCADILERSYSTVEPHMAAYWEDEAEDTLRADSYQDLVNALLLLINTHSESGIVRIYDDAGEDYDKMSADAGYELQHETALGAYLLDYMTYYGEQQRGHYELHVRFGYRRSEEQQQSIINTTSTEALPDLLREALREGHKSVTIRISYFDTDREGLAAALLAVHDEEFASLAEPGEQPPEMASEAQETEAPPDSAELLLPWTVRYYPDSGDPEIIEVMLQPEKT